MEQTRYCCKRRPISTSEPIDTTIHIMTEGLMARGDMVECEGPTAKPAASKEPAQKPVDPVVPPKGNEDGDGIDVTKITDVKELKALCDELGITYARNASAVQLREKLQKHADEAPPEPAVE